MEWRLFIFARRLVMLYISIKFCEINSNGIKVIERTWFLYWKFQREIIPQKMKVEWRLLISVRCLIMVYICAKFREIISNGIKGIERTRMFNLWRTDGRTDTQKFGGYNIIPRHFLWRDIKGEYLWQYLMHPALKLISTFLYGKETVYQYHLHMLNGS